MEIDVAAMKTIPVSEFKAKCIELLKDVQKTKEPILVTLRGVPGRADRAGCKAGETCASRSTQGLDANQRGYHQKRFR
ncbi:MAG: hypothetical protein DME54_12490 [Verrucomicrobia bacterium]|nr:MAG: hypothetical protein DME75_11060 [Verrucomicrobiota bacterium]PYK33449.1 MAG: hypothetical protein DME54_12490 [Verrucomicrobiota bacterium]